MERCADCMHSESMRSRIYKKSRAVRRSSHSLQSFFLAIRLLKICPCSVLRFTNGIPFLDPALLHSVTRPLPIRSPLRIERRVTQQTSNPASDNDTQTHSHKGTEWYPPRRREIRVPSIEHLEAVRISPANLRYPTRRGTLTAST